MSIQFLDMSPAYTAFRQFRPAENAQQSMQPQQYNDIAPAEQSQKGSPFDTLELGNAKQSDKTENEPSVKKCRTCENRKYQDGSNDPSVSFKTPTTLSPDRAAAAVRNHEMEHVFHEQANAKREDREVVSQSVIYKTDICPECHRVYVSGGETRTVTRAKQDNNIGIEQPQKGKFFDAVS